MQSTRRHSWRRSRRRGRRRVNARRLPRCRRHSARAHHIVRSGRHGLRGHRWRGRDARRLRRLQRRRRPRGVRGCAHGRGSRRPTARWHRTRRHRRWWRGSRCRRARSRIRSRLRRNPIAGWPCRRMSEFALRVVAAGNRDHAATDRTARANARRRHLGWIHAEDRPALRTRHVHDFSPAGTAGLVSEMRITPAGWLSVRRSTENTEPGSVLA